MPKVTQLGAAAARISTHVSWNLIPGTARDARFKVTPSRTQLITILLKPFRGKHPGFFENQKPCRLPSLLFAVSFPGDGLCLNGGGDGREEEREEEG